MSEEKSKEIKELLNEVGGIERLSFDVSSCLYALKAVLDGHDKKFDEAVLQGLGILISLIYDRAYLVNDKMIDIRSDLNELLTSKEAIYV